MLMTNLTDVFNFHFFDFTVLAYKKLLLYLDNQAQWIKWLRHSESALKTVLESTNGYERVG